MTSANGDSLPTTGPEMFCGKCGADGLVVPGMCAWCRAGYALLPDRSRVQAADHQPSIYLRLLCWIGWHRWGITASADEVPVGTGRWCVRCPASQITGLWFLIDNGTHWPDPRWVRRWQAKEPSRG